MDFLRRMFTPPDQEATLSAPVNQEKHVPVSRLRYGQFSDVGRSRKNNQDACMAFAVSHEGAAKLPSFGLFIVADGMGGHVDGEKASSLSMRIVAEHVFQHAYLPMLKDAAYLPDFMDIINDGVQAANTAVTEQMPNGGTTLTVVLVYDDQAYISQVGDSRAYLINGDQMQPITRDHSLVQRLVELEQLTPEQAAEHPHRNILYRAIGQSDYLELDSKVIPLPAHNRLLLCSDGLWTVVSEARIIDIITAAPDPRTACHELVEAANMHGGPDNITVILVDLPDPVAA